MHVQINKTTQIWTEIKTLQLWHSQDEATVGHRTGKRFWRRLPPEMQTEPFKTLVFIS